MKIGGVDSPVSIRMGPWISDNTPFDIWRLIIFSWVFSFGETIGFDGSMAIVVGNTWILGFSVLTERFEMGFGMRALFCSCELAVGFVTCGAIDGVGGTCCLPADARYWFKYLNSEDGAFKEALENCIETAGFDSEIVIDVGVLTMVWFTTFVVNCVALFFLS